MTGPRQSVDARVGRTTVGQSLDARVGRTTVGRSRGAAGGW